MLVSIVAVMMSVINPVKTMAKVAMVTVRVLPQLTLIAIRVRITVRVQARSIVRIVRIVRKERSSVLEA